MELREVSLISIYRKWKSNANVFEAFIRSSPFVSLQTYDNFQIDLTIDVESLLNKHNKIISKILSYSKEDFVICDIDFDECIEIAFLLNNKYHIKPIISFNMIFHPYGLIGTNTNIENIIKYGLNLEDIYPERYVLMCNYKRYENFSEDKYKKRLNNQYEVCEDDLPYVETLKNTGYNKVVFFTKGNVKEDIQNYLDYLNQSDFLVEIIKGEN